MTPVPLELNTIAAIAPLIRRGAISAAAVVRACLDRIEADNARLRAFTTVLADEALAAAVRADRDLATGRWHGPLHGIPIAVKDLIDLKGQVTTAASRVRAQEPPALTDAPVVARLRAAGAVFVGKTNLHEFAFGTTSEDSAYGAVRNPIDPSRSAGGSSGGSAAAIVAGMCVASVGTDTGGSVRIPCAACGLVGLKPTVGELSCEGVIPLASTLDHVGPMARTVADTTLLYQAMGGASVGAIPALNVLRLGVPDGYLTELLDEDIRRAFETSLARLSNAGCTIARVELPHASATPDVYLLISLAEAAEYHAPSVASVPDLYTAPVRQRIELGRYILAEDYLRARRAAVMLRAEVDRALAGHDALVLPTLPIPAPPLGASSMMVSGASQPVRAMMLRQTQLFNVTGHPAITLPNGASRDGLPAALQLVGARAGTARLLAVAAACEPHLASGPGSVGGGTAAGSETGGASASRTADSGGWRSEGS